jgi:hypothetical protein
MKKVKVEPATLEMNGTSLGTVKSVLINGQCELFAQKMNVWVNLMGETETLASKSLVVEEGFSEAGVSWTEVEADVLFQLGLTKSANQEEIAPAPTLP